jgi:hypothetical protein
MLALLQNTMINLLCMLTAGCKVPTTNDVRHSVQCLAFPIHQAQRVPALTGFDQRPVQNIMESNMMPMRGHYVRVSSKKTAHPLDSQPRQRITARELLSPAMPMADQIIEMRRKTQQIRLQHRGLVTHRGRVVPKLGETFDGAERREIGLTVHLGSYSCIKTSQKVWTRSFFILLSEPLR